MKKALFCFLASVLFCWNSCAEGVDLTSTPWSGILDAGGELRFVRLEFKENKCAIQGRLFDPEALSADAQVFSNVKVTQQTLTFDVPVGDQTISCQARRNPEGALSSDQDSCNYSM